MIKFSTESNVYVIFQICSLMPSMQDIFRYNPSSVLTIRKLNALLAPQFSPTGSNRRRFEGAVYAVFCKYVREVAGMYYLYYLN